MQEVRLQSGQSQQINNYIYCQIQMFAYKQIIQTTVCLHNVDIHLFVNNAVYLFTSRSTIQMRDAIIQKPLQLLLYGPSL